MLFYGNRQIFEGIDSIEAMIQPYLYSSFDLSKQLDQYHGVSLVTHYAKILQRDYGYFVYKPYHYLHISGEIINPERNILDAITNGISKLISKEILIYSDYAKGKKYDFISKDFIRNNLYLFIKGIFLVEFCFDFTPENIKISDNAEIIDTGTDLYRGILGKKIKERPQCLFRDSETTYYSNDFNKRRKSTLKLYDRDKCLKEGQHEYSFDFIDKNPYKKRIEFTLKRNLNTTLMGLDNFDGNYYQIIERFIPYLARLYKKYFLDLVKVNSLVYSFNRQYHYFNQIYELAHEDHIPCKGILKNINGERKESKRTKAFHREWQLIEKLRRYEKTKELSDSYFVNMKKNESIKYHTILDFTDKTLIDHTLSDNDVTFFKNDYITPLMIKHQR
jgi:hypothetical protein